ncbi:hypothetical protein KR018_005365 [Drosophila ironensis]|nr:hypothetical protein KR018_005365 [Drosophila ironensis]
MLELRMVSVDNLDGDEETQFVSNLKLIGRDRRLNGTVMFLMDFDNSIDIKGDHDVFKNGEWVTSNMKLNGHLCDVTNTFIFTFFPNWLAEGYFTDPPCPFRKGELLIRELNFGNALPRYLPKGLQKFSINHVKDGKSIGGFALTAVLEDTFYDIP